MVYDLDLQKVFSPPALQATMDLPATRTTTDRSATAIAAPANRPVSQAVPSPAASAPKPVPASGKATLPAAETAKAIDANQPVWREFFENWPKAIPTRGVVITQLNEPNPFKAFMLRGNFVLLERTTPDSMGGRFLVLPYAEIATLKFVDPLKQAAFISAGFQGRLTKSAE